MEIVLLKAIYGIFSGVILYYITVLLRKYELTPLNADYLLLAIYVALYFGYIPLMKLSRSHHRKHLTKGVTVYYSISFLTWTILYDMLTSFNP